MGQRAKMSEPGPRGDKGWPATAARKALDEARAILAETEPDCLLTEGQPFVTIGDGRTAYTFPPFDALADALSAFVEGN